MSKRLSIVVVEDQDLVAWGLRAVLGSQPWIARCVTTALAVTAIDAIRRFEPQVALVSTSLRDADAVELSRSIVRLGLGTRTLLLTAQARLGAETVRAAGAWGAVGKDWPSRRIVGAVHVVGMGGRMLTDHSREASDLSPQQAEVLRRMVEGATNREIALALAISPDTVKDHASALYRRLEVRNRTQAVQRAQALGLLA